MRPNDGVDRVVIPELDLYPLAQRRKHLGEDDLLVPHRRVAVPFHARLALQTKRHDIEIPAPPRENPPLSQPEPTVIPAKDTCT